MVSSRVLSFGYTTPESDLRAQLVFIAPFISVLRIRVLIVCVIAFFKD